MLVELKVINPMSLPSTSTHDDLFVVERGQGCFIYDKKNKPYLDGQAGLWCVNVGHNNAYVNEAINTQLKKIAFYNTFESSSNTPSLNLASKIISMLEKEKMAKVFFCSGGSDAIDSALKLSRLYWNLSKKSEKTKFISLQNGYHGLHFGGISISGSSIFQDTYGPLIPGCISVPYDGVNLAKNNKTGEGTIEI